MASEKVIDRANPTGPRHSSPSEPARSLDPLNFRRVLEEGATLYRSSRQDGREMRNFGPDELRVRCK